jgi:restriction endonuclease S subunit
MRGLSPIPYVRAANITPTGLNLSNLEVMDFTKEEVEHFGLKSGDILLTEASGSSEHVGRPAIWKGEVSPCCFQNTVLMFRSARIVPEFALAVFRYLQQTGAFKDAARGVGIQHLSLERFKQLPFPLAPVSVQKATVARLEKHLSRLTRARERVLDALKQLDSQKLRMASDILSGVGKENIAELGSVCEVYNGRAFKSSEWGETGLPIIRIQNLKDRGAAFNYFAGPVDERHRVNSGDLLFAWSGTPDTSFGAHLWNGPPALLNQHIFKIVPDRSKVSPEYLHAFLTNMLPHFVSLARGGGGLGHLNRRDFVSASIPIPSLSAQMQVVSELKMLRDTNEKQFSLLHSVLDRIRELEITVLSKACHGTLVRVEAAITANAGKELLELITADNRLNSGKQRLTTKKASVTPRRTLALPRKLLVEILRAYGAKPAQDLMAVSGYRYDSVQDVEAFYSELTRCLSTGAIVSSDGLLMVGSTKGAQ